MVETCVACARPLAHGVGWEAEESRAEAERLEDGTYVVAVAGEIDMSTAPSLQEVLDRVLTDTATSVVVDLTECSFIDSTGLGVLVRTQRRLHHSGRPLSLVSPGRHVLRALEVTGLTAVLETHATRAEALAGRG